LRGSVKKNSGFTLIEVMVSLLIMAISIVALHYMFHQGQILIMEQDHRRAAYHLAQKRLAAYKLLSDRHAIIAGTFTGEEYIVSPDDEYTDDAELMGEYTTVIELVDDYYQVTITYRWTELSSRKYVITLSDNYPVDPLG
jgi:prepilin-type N-terminal cleavage/methylation domain-containing protein